MPLLSKIFPEAEQFQSFIWWSMAFESRQLVGENRGQFEFQSFIWWSMAFEYFSE